ncbi:MAG: hypothetical protein JNM24_07475 [Bdellovibrionaceae bacterium]|nr:hypothetical protein [Pseudobdellovibrionaceae bacterium]
MLKIPMTIIAVTLILGSTGLTKTNPLKFQNTLSKDARFRTPSAKLLESDKAIFESIASAANLDYISQPKWLGYPVAFDLMATDSKFRKVIVFGSQRVTEDLAGKVFDEKDGIFTTVVLDRHPMTLLFVGFSLEEVQTNLHRMREVYAAAEQQRRGRMPAGETATSVSSKIVTTDGTKKPLSQYAYALGDSFKECGLGVVDGFNAITWDPIKKAGVSLWSLATDTRGWIERSKQEIRKLRDTVVNFDTFASKQWTDWRQKPPEEKSRIYCSFVGGAGGSALTMKVAGKLSANVASKTGTIAENTAQGAAAPALYKSGKAPEGLAQAAKNIVEPSPMYPGRTWWEIPPGGAQNYPYITDRVSLNTLKAMSEKPIPDPTKFTKIQDYDWKFAAQSLRDYPDGIQRINQAIATGSELTIGGRSYILIQGEKFNSVRLPVNADLKAAPAVRNNGLTGQRVLTDDGRFRSISSPAIEYQGNGMTGYSTRAPQIQGSDVKIITGDKVIEGTYLSSGGPGIPRGASYTQLSRSAQEGVEFHFIQVGDQTLMVPARTAEIFAYY